MKTILLLVAFLTVLPAQTDVRAPLQDPKAWALLDKAETLTKSARAAGLKDLTFVQTFSQYEGVKVEVKWMAPARTTMRVMVAEDAPQHVKTIADSLEKRLRPQVVEMLGTVVGRRQREIHADSEVSLVSERLVRIVPQSPRAAAQFSEHKVTFDLRGLPVTSVSRRTDGSVLEMQTAFETVKKDELFRVQSITVKARRAGQPDSESAVRYEWCEVKGFQFPKSIAIEHGIDRTILGFGEFKPDSGLTEKDFPAEK